VHIIEITAMTRPMLFCSLNGDVSWEKFRPLKKNDPGSFRTGAANYREFPGKSPTLQLISPEVPFSIKLEIVTSFLIRVHQPPIVPPARTISCFLIIASGQIGMQNFRECVSFFVLNMVASFIFIDYRETIATRDSILFADCCLLAVTSLRLLVVLPPGCVNDV
jgi:hypothetical protein